MYTETVVSLRIENIINGSVRVEAGAGRGGPGAVSLSQVLVNCPILLV